MYHRRGFAHERVLRPCQPHQEWRLRGRGIRRRQRSSIAPGDTALSGWTVNDNPLAWYAIGYAPNPLNPIGVGPHSGDLAINLCDGSVAVLCDGSVRPVSISQTLTILPFVEQQVSFWVGNYSGNRGPVSIGVTITDGTSNTLLLSETATSPATNLDFGLAGVHLFLHLPDSRRDVEYDRFLGDRGGRLRRFGRYRRRRGPGAIHLGPGAARPCGLRHAWHAPHANETRLKPSGSFYRPS